MTGGGADAVLELVGLAELVTEGVAMLDRGGSLVENGIFWPGQRVEFDPSTVVASGKRILGSNGHRPERLPVILDFLAQAHDQLPFEQLVSHRFGLDDINRAFGESEWQGSGTAMVRAAIQP